jgi:hypothetical protein
MGFITMIDVMCKYRPRGSQADQKRVSVTKMSSNEVVEKEAMEAIDKFDYIRFTFSDIHGIARSKSIARRNFHEFFTAGMTIFSGEHCAHTFHNFMFLPL